MINLHSESNGKVLIIHLDGSLSIENLVNVEAYWMDKIMQEPEVLAFNCHNLGSVDSSAIGSIVKFFNYAMKRGIMLVFYDLNPQIRRLFAAAKLYKFFTVTTRNKFESQYSLSNSIREKAVQFA